MECTQVLQCTQNLCDREGEKAYNDQIGILGICGNTYPVKKGPNKIGRDPQTCDIVLDLTSVSRQHAVINILNSTEFMIMDLDSANKTKLLNKTLPPYIPHILKHGDTIQFGQVFGVFRLLNDNSDLPMTQALDIPNTPLVNKNASKFCNIPNTVIPESPNISDKDESFIATPQPKIMDVIKKSNSNFIKCSGKSVDIQPVGTSKIDNIFWNSSKKSISMDIDLDGSIETTDNLSALQSSEVEENLNIHEMETQVPLSAITSGLDTIYTANTQMCTDETGVHSSISDVVKNNTSPDVQNVSNQHQMKLNLFVENKENNKSIYSADKDQSRENCGDEPSRDSFQNSFDEKSNTNHNVSDEEILFEHVDSQPLEEDFESQPLIHPESLIGEAITTNLEKVSKLEPSGICNNEGPASRKTTRVNSDSSTDCEDFDMLLTQKIFENQEDESLCRKNVPGNNKVNHGTFITSTALNVNDNSTDCEDNVSENKDNKKLSNSFKPDDDSTDCEDDIVCNSSVNTIVKKIDSKSPEKFAGQTITASNENIKENVTDKTTDLKFEEMLTQVIEEVDIEKDMCTSNNPRVADFEDVSTQIVKEEIRKENVCEQIKTPSEKGPFKVPMQSTKNFKRREVRNNRGDCGNCDDNFYMATQEIINDLCSQKEISIKASNSTNENHDKLLMVNNLYKTSDRGNERDTLIKKISSEQFKDKSVVEAQTKKIMSSDSSDAECTPKKIRPLKFMETELPDSQEIKKSVRLNFRTLVTESSSDSGSDIDLDDQHTPILHHKHIKRKNVISGLTKQYELDHLPTKIITRVRKPTAKVLNGNLENKNYLLPRFVPEQEENIDTDIIIENISRLKDKKNDVDDEVKTKNERKLMKLDSNYNKKLELPLNHLESRISRKDVETKSSKRKHNDTKTNIKKIIGDGNDDNKSSIRDHDNQKSLRLETEHKSCNEMQRNKVFDESGDSSSLTLRRTSRIKIKNENKDQSSGDSKTAKTDTAKNNTTKQASKSLSSNQRSSRSRCKNITSNLEKEDEVKLSDGKHRKKRNHRDSIGEESPEKELRRSKRQRKVKQNSESITEGNSKKHLNKKNQGEVVSKSNKKTNDSTVFSISSGSGTDSPNHKSLETPGRSVINTDEKKKMATTSSVHQMSTRVATRQLNTQFVLFTAFPSEEVKTKLEKLGAVIVTDVKACTVLLTLEIKRTFKLLCAVGLGRPIVGPSWVQACVDTKIIVDPWQYLIKDEAREKRFQFNLQRTLTGNRNFLKGYNVSSTPSVVPASLEMKLIVECSGGLWKEGGSKWLCISSSADKALWPTLKRRGAVIVNTELILGGALRQRLDIERNKMA